MTRRDSPDAAASAALAGRLAGGDRAALARAITLVESRRDDHRALALALIDRLMPLTGGAVRIGVTGVPGVGKSTLIDRFGANLVAAGRRVAVLAVDPSSVVTGGSLLADKTRMPELAGAAAAFVRPSPAAGTLGGVAARTREAMLVCEAAGFDVVVVETVGTGQSEVAVADMVDVFVALMLPGAGDELQGLKKGIVEIADVIAVNKAEGANAERAGAAAAEIARALAILGAGEGRAAPVLTVSGLANQGLGRLWDEIAGFVERRKRSGAFAARRAEQAVGWFRAILAERLEARLFAGDKERRAALQRLEEAVRDGRTSPAAAAEKALAEAGP